MRLPTKHFEFLKKEKEILETGNNFFQSLKVRQIISDQYSTNWIKESNIKKFFENVFVFQFTYFHKQSVNIFKHNGIFSESPYAINSYLTEIYLERIYQDLVQENPNQIITIYKNKIYTKSPLSIKLPYTTKTEKIDLIYFFNQYNYYQQRDTICQFLGFENQLIENTRKMQSNFQSELREYKLYKII